MRLTKEEFCAAVDKFEQMCKEEHDLLRALDIGAEWKPGQWISEYYYFLNDMCDFTPEQETTEYGNNLDYYCFELDFGSKWKPGMIKIDGKELNITYRPKNIIPVRDYLGVQARFLLFLLSNRL